MIINQQITALVHLLTEGRQGSSMHSFVHHHHYCYCFVRSAGRL